MLPMETGDLFERAAVALSIGLLIGLERGWRARDEEEGERAAGIRTHALSALLGAAWGAIAYPFGGAGVVALGLAFVAFSALIGAFRYREMVREQTFGATTLVAAMLAFALGAYAMVGDVQVAAAAGVATTALLAPKAYLHDFLRRITWAELWSGLVILVMTFVLLPVLPDRAIDRWDAINPAAIWLLTIMIAAISFVGYLAVKFVGGPRGLALAGLAGGLASSTAVTVAMARLEREQPGQAQLTTAAALFANMVMAPRVLAVVAVANVDAVARLAPPVLAAGAVFGLAGLFLQWRAEAGAEDARPLELKNPLDLGAVLKFGALLSAVMVLSKIAVHYAGNTGAYALAWLSGVADVDAIALSMAQLGGGALPYLVADKAILFAFASNTLSKAVMAWVTGGAGIGVRFALASVLALVAAAATYIAVA